MALCKLERKNYGGKLPVMIKYQNLHSFKEGLILLCQSILETRRITHLHGSVHYNPFKMIINHFFFNRSFCSRNFFLFCKLVRSVIFTSWYKDNAKNIMIMNTVLSKSIDYHTTKNPLQSLCEMANYNIYFKNNFNRLLMNVRNKFSLLTKCTSMTQEEKSEKRSL